MPALLFSNSLTFLSSLRHLSSSSSFPYGKLVFTSTRVSRLQFKSFNHHLKFVSGVRFQNATLRSRTVSLNASSVDGAAPNEDADLTAESKEEVLPVDKLPLESKLQERMEQKMRMKLAKKIRLRRKRLLRKRRLRKKGRWPPSKMKKLKNV